MEWIIIILACCLIFPGYFSLITSSHRKSFPWRRFSTIEDLQIQKILTWIAQDFDSSLAYKTAIMDRQQFVGNNALVYGEIPILVWLELLSWVRPKRGEIFCDLGSGDGKIVCASQLMFPFQKSIGIELLSNLHRLSITNTERLIKRQYLPTHFAKANIQWLNNDYFHTDFHQADIVFINATTIFGYQWAALVKKLHQLKENSRIIVTSRYINSPLFLLTHHVWRPMSWGENRVNIYQKIGH